MLTSQIAIKNTNWNRFDAIGNIVGLEQERDLIKFNNHPRFSLIMSLIATFLDSRKSFQS